MVKLNRKIAMVGAALVLSAPSSAMAADFEADFPAGEACDFALHVTGTGGNSTVRHENGTVITAGKGSALTISGNGNSISLRSNGAANRLTDNGDGTSTLQIMGHNLLVLFSTDVGGPSARLIGGRAVVDIDSNGVWEVVSISGRVTDVCAALD